MENNAKVIKRGKRDFGKTCRIDFFKLTYTIDFAVLFLFFGVFLDIISTFLFVELNTGPEANVILKELIPISIWFVPVYLFSTNALFVPFLSNILRKTLSYNFGLVGILFALNNFSLLIFHNAFLVYTFGFNTLFILYLLFGLPIFIYLLKQENLNIKEMIFTVLKLIIFLVFIDLVHLLFLAITWI